MKERDSAKESATKPGESVTKINYIPIAVTMGITILVLIGVFIFISLNGNEKPEPNFDDGYSTLYYNVEKWIPGEDLSSELQTTAISFQWKDNPEVCEVAFFALPPESLTGEAWLNQVYDAADQQFGALNKQLQHSSDSGRGVTTLEFQYQNGTEVTSMYGKAFTNDNGVIIGLATINTPTVSSTLRKDMLGLIDSVSLYTVPKFTEDKSAGMEGIHMIPMEINGTTESCYVFTNGQTDVGETEIQSVLGGVSIWYEVQSGLTAEESDEAIAKRILDDQERQYNELAEEVVQEEPVYSESTRSVLGQINCVDGEQGDKYQTVYRFTRLDDNYGMLWAMQINMTQATQEESSLAFVMLQLHGVGIK